MSVEQPSPTPAAAPQSPNGEAAFAPQADAAREARRMARLEQLERLRDRADRVSVALCDMIEGKLPPEDFAAFAHINDPTLAFTRVCTAIRRIVALEERIDEDAETHAERLAAEAAERAKAEAAEQVAEAAARNQNLIRVNRHVTDKFLREDIRARGEDMTRIRREMLLRDLTSDLDDLDYMGDPDALIARIREELDSILGPPPAANENEDAPAPPSRPRGYQPVSIADIKALMQETSDAIHLALLREAER